MEKGMTYSKLPADDNRRSSFDADVEDSVSGTTEVFGSTIASMRSQSSVGVHRDSCKDVFGTFWIWIRWTAVVGLQIIVILLLSNRSPQLYTQDGKLPCILPESAVGYKKGIETGGDINGLYKTLSHTYSFLKPEPEKYIPNMTSDGNREEIRRNWDLLMPRGSGSILIPDYQDYPLLGEPITDDPIRSGPVFEASWTHALHCLYYNVDSYHQLLVNGRTEKDNPHHATHCFEYLRNNILCNLDMTLEGSMSKAEEKERGQAHVCRNRNEVVKWIEDRRTDDLQDIVGP